MRDIAVSPVVGVILMVAVTVILSAAVGIFVLNIGEQTTSGSQNNLGVKTTETNGSYEISVITGSADELRVRIDGEPAKILANPSAGDMVTVETAAGETVSVVAVSNDEMSVVSTRTASTTSAFQNGLVAHYRFGAGDGSTVFDTANDFDGDIHGATWVTMNRTSALSFDGSDDNVTATTDSTVNPTNITVSVWVYLNDSSTYWMVVDKGVSHPGTYYLYDTSTHSMHWTVKNESGSRWDATHPDSNLANNTWHHLVGTYNDSGGVMRLYVNGTVVDTVTGAEHAGSNSQPLLFGKYKGGGYHLDGVMREVRIYNRSLSKQEVAALYNATK